MTQLLLLQKVIDHIDNHIKEDMKTDNLAQLIGYSPFHFSRIFHQATGYTPMDYVQKRKLQFALVDLLQGKRIIDIAVEYGFETHAGFTKSFKRCFGSPPSLYRMHCPISFPQKLCLESLLQKKTGGIVLQPKIISLPPFMVAGKTFETRLKNITYTRDAPAFWDQRIPSEESIEATLYDLLSPKIHGEYCFNLSGPELENHFTYLFTVNYDEGTTIPEGIIKLQVKAATYAVFKTPLVLEEHFVSSIKGTWQYILEDWLPNSQYEVDEGSYDFEYYDEHCHDWEYDKIYMEIYLPIKEKL
ncbi:AraC family transcriptional regulator [Psychrobacillus sp. FSL W7-1457]|uniref:AraC family transcriptional regulator n=1 Tax=Psychrobacillus sp. FSL W7-1457 TaxID=2954547 RepID=UPI003159D25A